MANKNEKTTAAQHAAVLNSSESFLLKNKKVIVACVIAIIVIVAGVSLFQTYYSGPRAEKASTALAKGQQLFMEEQYEKALKGDSTGFAGFLSVAEEYGSTDAGNLAKLYAGLCYAKLEKWEEAAAWIDKFSPKDDQMISPAAEGALGNVYAHQNQLDKAVEQLKKAAKHADNSTLSPLFLLQAGEILESQDKKEEALKLYQEIKDKYFDSYQAGLIDKYIERATTK